jgi:signal transduction histidine kinase
MNNERFSNKQLLDELNRRLAHEIETGHASVRLEEEVRKLSARLQESENCKSRFLSNVRNELNNPIASIIGLAASIHGLTAEEKVKTLSGLIHKQATELDFQMRNMIIAAEIEMGEVKPCASRVNVVSVIESQISYFSHLLEENKISVVLQTPDHLRFKTDAYVLETICMNLLSNAVAFCGAKKKVVIKISEDKGNLELIVSDFGDGIDPSIQANIFQRFNQGETGLCKRHKGQGLGLSIVNELVNILGGQIMLESQRGEGTSIHINLPELAIEIDSASSSAFGNELLFTIDEEF